MFVFAGFFSFLFFMKKENHKIFVKTNQTMIIEKGLTPNTWYQLCFECRLVSSVKTINHVQCIRQNTKPSSGISVE